MRLKEGSVVPNIILSQIFDTKFDTSTLAGKPYLLSFFRFATCPFCNLRIHELIQRQKELGKDFNIVAIFESPIVHLEKHMASHEAPFPILSDTDNYYYRAFGIEHSVLGMLKGMIFRFPTLIKGMLRGYIPYVMKGSMIKMPADFLINTDGTIAKVYYAKDEGDHLPFDEIKNFSLSNQ